MLYNTPILFLVFNRPETTIKVFEEIRKIRPKQLFIAADGYRPDKVGEETLCKEVKSIVSNIDWNCEVHRLFRNENLGCGKAVSSAISWFFENVEEGIILEDDCLPNQSFFNFCQELLIKYRNVEDIMMISGNNFLNNHIVKNNYESYYFSKYAFIWGWASWRRSWKEYDINIVKENEKINKNLKNKKEQKYWLNIFDLVSNKKIDTWDYQWVYTIFKMNRLTIVPNINLVSNIGFGNNSTHTLISGCPLANLKTFSLNKIIHPKQIKQNIKADKYVFENFFYTNKNFLNLLLRKTKQILIKLYNFYLRLNISDQIKKRNKITEEQHFNRITNKGTDIFYDKGFAVFNGHNNIFLGSNINLVDTLFNAGDNEGKIIIEDYVFFGHRVQVLARGHDYKSIMLERQQNVIEKQIHIKEGAWIGSGSIILGGVTIGKNSVIAAGSIVIKDVPDNSIFGGNPAKFIKNI